MLRLEVIYGPMFSGKSRELIQRLSAAEEAGQSVLALRPVIGSGITRPVICSRDGLERSAVLVRSAAALPALVGSFEVVGLDEIQFFDEQLVRVIEGMPAHLQVIAAGLDLDFRGKPFGPTLCLAIRASAVTSLSAVCTNCGRKATMTQRLVNGLPAASSDPTVVLEAAASYEPRCELCHVIE